MPITSSEGGSPFLPRSASVSGTRPLSQVARHGKYIAIGLLGVWYCDALQLVRQALDADVDGSWFARKGSQDHRGRKTMSLSLGLQGVTIAIFLYLVVFLPWFRGYLPNYPLWQRSRRLRLMVPVLTFSILVGWLSCVRALKIGAGVGLFKAMLAATSMYLLIFGCIGLIPTPMVPMPKVSHSRNDMDDKME